MTSPCEYLSPVEPGPDGRPVLRTLTQETMGEIMLRLLEDLSGPDLQVDLRDGPVDVDYLNRTIVKITKAKQILTQMLVYIHAQASHHTNLVREYKSQWDLYLNHEILQVREDEARSAGERKALAEDRANMRWAEPHLRPRWALAYEAKFAKAMDDAAWRENWRRTAPDKRPDMRSEQAVAESIAEDFAAMRRMVQAKAEEIKLKDADLKVQADAFAAAAKSIGLSGGSRKAGGRRFTKTWAGTGQAAPALPEVPPRRGLAAPADPGLPDDDEDGLDGRDEFDRMAGLDAGDDDADPFPGPKAA